MFYKTGQLDFLSCIPNTNGKLNLLVTLKTHHPHMKARCWQNHADTILRQWHFREAGQCWWGKWVELSGQSWKKSWKKAKKKRLESAQDIQSQVRHCSNPKSQWKFNHRILISLERPSQSPDTNPIEKDLKMSVYSFVHPILLTLSYFAQKKKKERWIKKIECSSTKNLQQ